MIHYLLQLNSDSDQVSWSYFNEVYCEDIKNPVNLRIIPRITSQHLNLTPMAKMRVRLCTQVKYYYCTINYNYLYSIFIKHEVIKYIMICNI